MTNMQMMRIRAIFDNFVARDACARVISHRSFELAPTHNEADIAIDVNRRQVGRLQLV